MTSKQIKITDIPKTATYVGYLWMSNQTKPEIKELNEVLKSITDTSNPFIIEGQLLTDDKRKSYSIKYVDGRHLVVEYNLTTIPASWISEDIKQFIPNRLEGVSKILFRRYWMPKEDPLCEGMEVLIPAAYVFEGFELLNTEKL